MNFLLHRHLATRDFGSGSVLDGVGDGGDGEGGDGEGARAAEIAGLGSMLPDVWGMASRRLRPRPIDPSGPPRAAGLAPDDPVEALLRGIDHHLWVDDWFHRHPVLAEGETRLGEVLRPLGVRYLQLFAHIGWELCLDGALLRRDGLEVHLEPLRRARSAVRGAPLRDALHHHVDAPPAGAVGRVEELLDHIAQGDWPAGYATADGLVARLEGVRRRVGVDPIPATVLPAVVDAFAAALDHADQALPDLLTTRPRP